MPGGSAQSSEGLTVLGVDPGSRCTGYGIVNLAGGRLEAVVFGAIRCNPGKPLQERLARIHEQLSSVLHAQRPDVVAVESLFYASNVKSALILGHVRGVALLSAALAGLPVFEYSPMEVKLAVTGYGRADKQQIAAMVRALLELGSARLAPDAADALAVAVCHAHSHKMAVAAVSGRSGSCDR